MDTVTILRSLWRRRIFVVAAALVALLFAMAVKFKLPSLESRQYKVGVATVHILVDTPSSQVVNIAPRGSDTTSSRASLLASLMVEGDIENAIAHRAGLRPSQLSGATGAAISPSAGGPSSSAPSGPTAYALNTQVLTNTTGDVLPIIEVDTQAPTPAGAERLANAAISGLTAYLNSKAALEKIPDADRLDVTGMGAPEATLQAHGPGNGVVLLVFVLVFVTGCIGILVGQALVRGWRAASWRERRGGAGAPLETMLDAGAPLETMLDGGVPLETMFDGGAPLETALEPDAPPEREPEAAPERSEAPELVGQVALGPVEDDAEAAAADDDLLWASLGFDLERDSPPAVRAEQ